MTKANGRKNADNKVILALACGATIESAARQSGVSETTIYRRLNEPSFQLRLREVQADILNRTAAALTAAATESVRTLMELQKPGTRLGAARAVIELGLRFARSSHSNASSNRRSPETQTDEFAPSRTQPGNAGAADSSACR